MCESNFKVNLSDLNRPKKMGISGIMRIKNGEYFLALTIEKHLPYYDEIIACYNDCTDNTVAILKQLQQKYPDKVIPYHYEPEVYPLFSEQHTNAEMSDIHSMANYYNYALSKASYSVATKLDDDHYPIETNLAPLIATIRADIAAGKNKIYTFSGINVAKDDEGHFGIPLHEPVVGTGDHMYFPVCSNIYFEQGPNVEVFKFCKPKFEKQYYGLMYLHLKFLKADKGYHNLPLPQQREYLKKFDEAGGLAPCNAKGVEAVLKKLKLKHSSIELKLRSIKLLNQIIYKLFNKHLPLRIARINSFKKDFNSIDFAQLKHDLELFKVNP